MKYSNLVTENNVTSVLIKTENLSEINLLRRAILNEIETYQIEYVNFHINRSSRHDEEIALRLGQLVVDNENYDDSIQKHIVKVKGPTIFTTRHIPSLNFVHETPIMELLEDHEIYCELYIGKNTGEKHVKWRPVSVCSFEKSDKGYLFRFKSNYMLHPENIIIKGIEKMEKAKQIKNSNIFFTSIYQD
jgi:DNA-directed RNA polymerase alpha subunit